MLVLSLKIVFGYKTYIKMFSVTEIYSICSKIKIFYHSIAFLINEAVLVAQK